MFSPRSLMRIADFLLNFGLCLICYKIMIKYNNLVTTHTIGNCTASGDVITKFDNVNSEACSDLCHKVDECVLSEWSVHRHWYWFLFYKAATARTDRGRCKLLKSVTRLEHDASESSVCQWAFSDPPYACLPTLNNKLFYATQSEWKLHENVKTRLQCIETCMLSAYCRFWSFDQNKIECFTTTSMIEFSKWTYSKGMITGLRCYI